MGRNYHAHIAELNNKAPPEPMWFDKPMSSLLLPGESLKWLPQYKDIHHEIELGVVIGKGGKDISEEESMDHVESYFLGVDFTNRGLQDDLKAAGADWGCLAKGADTFGAISDFVDKNKIEKWDDLELELAVNGDVKQSANTKLMIFGLPRLISDASRYMRLNQGDLIYTGTPAGVGPVREGDVLTGLVRKPGSQENLAELEVKVE